MNPKPEEIVDWLRQPEGEWVLAELKREAQSNMEGVLIAPKEDRDEAIGYARGVGNVVSILEDLLSPHIEEQEKSS